MSEKAKNLFLKELLIPGQKLLPGIVGGIGPLSHTDFERLMLQVNTTATRDQDHPMYLLLNATSIPDRTVAIKKEKAGDSSLSREVEDKIVAFINQLADNGCDFVDLICNTSHYWHPRVKDKIKIPWIHMMQVTARMIKETYEEVKNVGILATDGTLMSRLYHDALEAEGLKALSPQVGSDIQNDVMTAIYDTSFGIKATKNRVDEKAIYNLVKGADYLKENGAEIIIAGCTEISVALPPAYRVIPVVDPMLSLAQVTFDLSMGRRDLKDVIK